MYLHYTWHFAYSLHVVFWVVPSNYAYFARVIIGSPVGVPHEDGECNCRDGKRGVHRVATRRSGADVGGEVRSSSARSDFGCGCKLQVGHEDCVEVLEGHSFFGLRYPFGGADYMIFFKGG